MATDQEKLEEYKKMRRLQFIVDLTCNLLYQKAVDIEEAHHLIRGVKGIALHWFPEKEQTFELIYGARFRRILRECYALV